MTLRILMTVLAYMTLAAHFSRADNVILGIVFLILPFLLFMKRRWVVRSLQIILFAGAVEWVMTTIRIVRERIAAGEDWVRVVIILGCVILFTIFTGILLNSDRIKSRYPSRG